MTIEFERFSSSLKKTVSIPDKVTELLRGMILSGKWRPGDRIVETKVARQLGIGQPTIREALGKLEEAGLVQRYPNSGCVVTQLSEEELGQMFRVRIELECLAVELATENNDPRKGSKLKSAFAKLEKAARKSKVDEYYRADYEFHQTIWQLAGNRFLEKALSQVVIPLFNLAILGILANRNMDFVSDAKEHGRLVDAILKADKGHARQNARTVLNEFLHRGLAVVHEGEAVPHPPRQSAKPKRTPPRKASLTT